MFGWGPHSFTRPRFLRFHWSPPSQQCPPPHPLMSNQPIGSYCLFLAVKSLVVCDVDFLRVSDIESCCIASSWSWVLAIRGVLQQVNTYRKIHFADSLEVLKGSSSYHHSKCPLNPLFYANIVPRCEDSPMFQHRRPFITRKLHDLSTVQKQYSLCCVTDWKVPINIWCQTDSKRVFLHEPKMYSSGSLQGSETNEQSAFYPLSWRIGAFLTCSGAHIFNLDTLLDFPSHVARAFNKYFI